MSDLRTAAQQALKVLESHATHGPLPGRCPVREAEYALRAALAQPEQEPVARVIDDETPEGSTEWIPYSGRQVPVKTGDLLYTHPPRREWQSLTQEELDRWTPEIHSVIRAIEAVLKERNA